MASDPFCGVASGSVEVHWKVEGSAPFCAKQTGVEHQIAKSHRSEATVKTPVPRAFANEQRNVNEVNLKAILKITSLSLSRSSGKPRLKSS
jgi:hypothetical protein